jgi:outer membrane immunogenic protein
VRVRYSRNKPIFAKFCNWLARSYINIALDRHRAILLGISPLLLDRTWVVSYASLPFLVTFVGWLTPADAAYAWGLIMRRFQCAAIAAVAVIGFASITHAADMPVKAPPAPVAVANWSGWYAGLNAGGDWGTSDPSTTTLQTGFFGGCPVCVSAIADNGHQSFRTDGFTGGGQGGYNWQFGNWVAGVEADFEYFRSAGSNSVTFVSFLGSNTINSSMRTDWLFTARPRLGVVANNNYLFYGTGGLAVTELRANWSYTDTYQVGATESGSASQVRAGWTVGGGVEAMLPGKWVVGVEYLFVKFPNVSTTSTNLVDGPLPSAVFTHSADLASSIVRLRVSEKF